jgi:phage shock protein PspC (stress-responsive transcriptional regulator)
MNRLFRNYGLFRDPSRGWIAGVSAGLAERFGLTDTVIRLLFVLLAFAGTPILAVIGYTVLAVSMPVRPVFLETRADRARPYR